MRKPLTGLLTMRIQAVRDVDHAAMSRFSRGPETFVIVKVEDTIKARTKASRVDRWQDETFNIDIDKANEVELTVYDKSGDRPTPIGMLWLRISDIAEEMRRKKIETEFNASGWVSADKMDGGHGGPGRQTSGGPTPSPQQPVASGHPGAPGPNYGGAPGAPPFAGQVMIDSWFALEPVGRIHLTMSFGKVLPLLRSLQYTDTMRSQTIEGPSPVRYWSQSPRCRPTEEGRCAREAGPQVRHPAVLQHYALCSMRRLFEIRCRDAVHGLQIYLPSQVLSQGSHQVYQQSELRNGPRRGEDQPPHPPPFRRILQPFRQLVLPLRIPTSFWTQECQAVYWYSPSVQWCLCNANGLVIECGITCHAQCTHLVPDFCGMSMEAANQILETLIRTKNHNKSASVSSGLSGRTLRPGGPPQAHQDLAYPQKPAEASADAVSAATNSYMTPQSPTAARQQIPPRAPPASGQAAAAAVAAAAGLRTSQQPIPGAFNSPFSLSNRY